MVEFVSEREARVIDECGLSLKQVHFILAFAQLCLIKLKVQVNYGAFLSCAYFVSRDRYFKKRISEFTSAFAHVCIYLF